MRILNAVILSLLSTLITSTTYGTIYLVATDPATHSVGAAVISSGPVVTYRPQAMSGIKGVGFTGWSGSTLNISPSMDKKVFALMQQSTPPDQIAAYVDSQIHEKYSRYIFVSTQGTLGYVFPPNGCAEPECGVTVSPTQQFFVMGGGLKHDVVQNTVKIYENIHKNNQLPFECKLLAGIQTIINVGGEKKEFQESVIGVDNPNRPQQEWFKSAHVPEKGIVGNLRSQMVQMGINCPTMRQVPDMELKPVRDSQSVDLAQVLDQEL